MDCVYLDSIMDIIFLPHCLEKHPMAGSVSGAFRRSHRCISCSWPCPPCQGCPEDLGDLAATQWGEGHVEKNMGKTSSSIGKWWENMGKWWELFDDFQVSWKTPWKWGNIMYFQDGSMMFLHDCCRCPSLFHWQVRLSSAEFGGQGAPRGPRAE